MDQNMNTQFPTSARPPENFPVQSSTKKVLLLELLKPCPNANNPPDQELYIRIAESNEVYGPYIANSEVTLNIKVNFSTSVTVELLLNNNNRWKSLGSAKSVPPTPSPLEFRDGSTCYKVDYREAVVDKDSIDARASSQ